MALLRGKTKVGKIAMRASIHLGLFRMNVVSLLLLTCAGLGAGSSLADVKSQADNLLLAQNQEASSSKKESRQSATDKKSSSSDRGEGTPVQAGSFRNAALFAVLLTVLITLIEIPAKSKATLRASCSTVDFFLYLIILAIGNGVAAVLSLVFVPLPVSLSFLAPFLHAFLGVFAFQGVMSNTNITFLDKGGLTIQDWIDKAQDNASGAAIAKNAQNQQQKKLETARALMKLEDGKLDAVIDNHLGRDKFELIAAAAAKHGDNAKFYKALEFATRDLNNAAATAKGPL